MCKPDEYLASPQVAQDTCLSTTFEEYSESNFHFGAEPAYDGIQPEADDSLWLDAGIADQCQGAARGTAGQAVINSDIHDEPFLIS